MLPPRFHALCRHVDHLQHLVNRIRVLHLGRRRPNSATHQARVPAPQLGNQVPVTTSFPTTPSRPLFPHPPRPQAVTPRTHALSRVDPRPCLAKRHALAPLDHFGRDRARTLAPPAPHPRNTAIVLGLSRRPCALRLVVKTGVGFQYCAQGQTCGEGGRAGDCRVLVVDSPFLYPFPCFLVAVAFYFAS